MLESSYRFIVINSSTISGILVIIFSSTAIPGWILIVETIFNNSFPKYTSAT